MTQTQNSDLHLHTSVLPRPHTVNTALKVLLTFYHLEVNGLLDTSGELIAGKEPSAMGSLR
jgi:hypothetical protein